MYAFSTSSETSSALQASGPLWNIDHTHRTDTVHIVLLLRRKEDVLETENPPQMPSDYIMYLAGSSREARFILSSALCQWSRAAFGLQKPPCQFRAWTNSIPLLTDNRGSTLWFKGNHFSNKDSSSCSGKGLIIIWFLPLHSPTKYSFSPQNRSVSVDTLNSLHLAHAHAVLMQGHGFTEPGLVTRVQMHPEHRGLTSTVQITGTHFWARSPRQCLRSNTYRWTLFETVTNCQETCNKNIFRATEWLRVPKLSKREESIQNKETVSFFISTLPSRLKYEPGNARMRESTCNAWYYRFNFFHHLYILLSHVHWIMIRYSSPEIELENHFWQNSSLDALQSIWRVVNQHAT